MNPEAKTRVLKIVATVFVVIGIYWLVTAATGAAVAWRWIVGVAWLLAGAILAWQFRANHKQYKSGR
jgi:uncharacterized membrane protein HdeD (DUF308 family)